MKKLFSILLLLVALIIPAKVNAQALNEKINSFHSEIEINQDTSLSITETIDYETTLTKHGIYRYIPVIYNHNGTKLRRRISQIKITDENLSPIPYTQSFDSKNLTLKIGDPDVTFTGQKTYVISYTVERGLNQLANNLELYWDITGEGWQIPILRSSATVTSPFADMTKIACYSGFTGSNDNLCQTQSLSHSVSQFNYDQTVQYGDNFTVLIALKPDNQLIFPSQLGNFMLWLKFNWTLALIPLPLTLIFSFWFKKGRDWEFVSPNIFMLDAAQPQRLIIPSLSVRTPFVYEPLKNLSPGEAGAMLDEKVDNQDLVAEILELARKKQLSIKAIEQQKLFGKSRDYELTNLNANSSQLTAVQKYLYEELFKSKDKVKISSLKGKFYSKMQKASELLSQQLVDKNLFTSKSGSAKGLGIFSFMASWMLVFGLIIWQFLSWEILWPLPLLIIQLPFGLYLAWQMPQKTARGRNLFLQARGLKYTINTGKWREKIKEKNLFIEEVLPFAVSLGVVSQLAKHMEQLNIKPPEYLQTSNLAAWSPANFVSNFSNEVGSTLSYNPSSSSSGSGSGGGSSGGGGGGGGGGSW